MHAASPKAAFGYGWLFAFGYFVCSLSWIGNALLVDGNNFAWAWPLAVSGLPALLAFFWAFAALIAKRFLDLRTLLGWLGFISIFCVFEWLRGHIFTGFPWNLFGYTWADTLHVLQILWLSDVYFLTWLTLLWCSLPLVILVFDGRSRALAFCIGFLSFAMCFGYGLHRMGADIDVRDDINIRIVQPNIPQADKWKGDQMWGHFEHHLSLSQNDGSINTPTVIIWPETALSFRILKIPQAMPAIQAMLRSYDQAVLLTGMLRYDEQDQSYANSLVTIDANGQITNVYDKHHLVPFGEYIPFQEWIPLTPVVKFKGFEKGSGVTTHTVFGSLKYSPLICYEILFPGRSVIQEQHPDVIVNVTNDAWYGESAGPYQHFNKAIYRAIETGVPVVRAANSGFSGLVNALGRVDKKTTLFESTAVNLPLQVTTPASNIYYSMKHVFIIIFFVFLGFLGIRTKKRSTRSGRYFL